MLVQRSNPIGIDYVICQIQSKIYSYLTEKKGWTSYNSYDRAYINYNDKQIIPEIYVGNGEYIDALMNDKIKAMTYFIVEDNRSYSNDKNGFNANISLIFQGNIKSLYPSITHRADEELHKELFNSLKYAYNSAVIESLKTGVDNVYSSFNFDESFKEKIKNHNIGKYHVCRLDFNINFKYCK